MKLKLGWMFLLSLLLFGIQLNAQLEETELSDSKFSEKNFLRYGAGFSNQGSTNPRPFINLESGYSFHFNRHVATSIILNYGMGFEYGEINALQSNLSTVLLFSPFKNNEEFVIEFGFGVSTMASYYVFRGNDKDNGGFLGGCWTVEFSYFSKKRKKYRHFNFFLGKYESKQSILGFSTFNEISIEQIKRDRKRQKEKLRF